MVSTVTDIPQKPHYTGQRQRRSKSLEWLLQHVSWMGDECLMWPFYRHRYGYGRIGYHGEHWYAHRKMCIERHGPPPGPEYEASHLCGKGLQGCVNPKHLCWATRKENEKLKLVHGTLITGTKHYRSHLTPNDIAAIRAASISAIGSVPRLAAKYGIHKNSIWRIRRYASYRAEALGDA